MTKIKPIIVNIKGDHLETRKIRPTITSEGRTILVMEKATDQKAGWSIDVTGAISTDIKRRQVIDVLRGDIYPLKYHTVDEDTTIRRDMFPHLSIDHLKAFADLEIWKKGMSNVKEQLAKLTPLMWVILVLVIISLILSGICVYMLNNLDQAVAALPHVTPAPTPR